MKSNYYKYLAFFINIFLIIFLLAQPIYSNTFQENYNQKFIKIQDITIPFIKNTGFIDDRSVLFFAKTFSGTISTYLGGLDIEKVASIMLYYSGNLSKLAASTFTGGAVKTLLNNIKHNWT